MNADFVARTHCAVEFIPLKKLQVRCALHRNFPAAAAAEQISCADFESTDVNLRSCLTNLNFFRSNVTFSEHWKLSSTTAGDERKVPS